MAKKNTVSKTETPSEAYAIVEASGQQFWLQENRYYDLDRLKAEIDQTISINNVLLLNNGKETTLGTPYIQGASVELKVIAHRRGPKIIVYKMRPKKKTRRKNGHRQELTRVMVQTINDGSKPAAATKAASTKASPTKAASSKAASAKAPSTKV